ncbi:hypothetical protein [Paenibacillus nasutitermitis]|uniref:ABC-2 family transporter protein n=1 Tax=Paenibacillus nasutitermitis TaxID=1652958 RepID=A0A917DVI9_9BACL|nr:hypothetical protein [Paenibacillus nasutitermitis]GGD70921.1 hypothetical protein GCM10010911_31000 [Paenibacillus nasutitermitis]
MIHYLKLVHMELSRFSKIYISLFSFVLLAQFAIVWMKAREITNEAAAFNGLNLNAGPGVLYPMGKVNFADVMSQSMFYMIPAFLCASVLLLYIFGIWYRDWLFMNSFIYRLLMLPGPRYSIYFAKLSAIIVLVLGMVAYQLALLPLEITFFHALVPEELRDTVSTMDYIRSDYILQLLLPSTFMAFVIYYGTGLLAVSILFTSILIERSYRWKGLAGGIGFAGLCVLIVISPFLIWDSIESHLYPMEIFMMELALGLIVGVMSIWTGMFLIKKKVSV